MNIPIRTFAQSTETDFLDESAVPSNLRDWWLQTRENLSRMNDRVSDMEAGDNLSPDTLNLKFAEGSASQLFAQGTTAYDTAEQDFLNAFRD